MMRKIIYLMKFVSVRKKLINIVIPNSRLSWSNIEHIAGLFLQGKTFEVLKLKGQLSHN